MAVSTAEIQVRQALLRRGIQPLTDQGEPLSVLLKRLVENVEGQAKAMLAAVFLYDPANNDLTIGSAPNLQPVYKRAVNGFRCGPQQPACGSAVFRRQPVICADVMTDPLWAGLRETAAAIGVRAVWSHPILAGGGEVLGTVAFYLPEPQAPDAADCVILETAASIAGDIIAARAAEARNLIRAQAARHQCLVYDGPPSRQLPFLAALVRAKLEEGYQCLYLNSPAMVAGLRSSLAEVGVDVVAATACGRLVLSSDSHSNTDTILDLLEEAVGASIKDGYKGLWASGDMTWEFGAEKDFAKLLEYERRLEQIFERHDGLHGICQYHKDTLPAEAVRDGLLSHRSVLVGEA
jgi:hypothetical protein